MSTRRFLRLMVGVGVGLVALSLVWLGPDLFYAIPWRVRKAGGWVGFAALIAVLGWRLVQVRPGDDGPPSDDGPRPAPWWPAWVGVGAIGVVGEPLLRHRDHLGFGDWDWFLTKYEAARQSILVYGQFPWWDPWTRGGFPLAANPLFGAWGLAMPLVLLCGTSVGMRLATLACLLLACEGARRLARLWFDDPVAAVFAGLVYGFNGGVLLTAVAGYHILMGYPVLPWMLYYVFRLERRRLDGVWLGFWGAFNLLNGIQYLTIYLVMIVGVVWLRRLVVRIGSRADMVRYLGHSALAVGTVCALAGWRLATTGLLYRDFPRVFISGYDEGLGAILAHLLGRPSASQLVQASTSHFWETTCYVGPVVLGLATLSLRGGWRWWHTLTLLSGWLAAGSVAWYHPSYWLSHFPGFATMHVVTRWRYMALLGLALAASSVVAAWHRDGRPSRRWLAWLAVLAVAGDYLTYGRAVLPVGFSVTPDPGRFPGPELPPGQIVQLGEWLGFPAVLRGYGVIPGYEPMLGYDRQAPTARHSRGGPDDRGEHWTARGPARVVGWSPNRIVLAVEPRELVFINQNPGSSWWVNGRPAFPEWRAAETRRPFTAVADDQGRVVLEIHPRGLRLGGMIHLAGGLLVAITWLLLCWADTARPAGPADRTGVDRRPRWLRAARWFRASHS